MFTVNVIHEVRWLPNDVEARLGDLAMRLNELTVEIETIKMGVAQILHAVEGQTQQKLDELAASLKPEADALERAAQPDSQ
jgi:hypothetical protein